MQSKQAPNGWKSVVGTAFKTTGWVKIRVWCLWAWELMVPVRCKDVNIGLIYECCLWLIIITGATARTLMARAVKTV